MQMPMEAPSRQRPDARALKQVRHQWWGLRCPCRWSVVRWPTCSRWSSLGYIPEYAARAAMDAHEIIST
ncbi:hypothetical protein GQ600_9522 [Phytophthora cactorum]|nr:hypothetical protein GQ600_9522 [Phytophthora cactorum]